MARKTFSPLARQPFIVDPESIDRNDGRQINWDLVDNSYREGAQNVTVNGAAAAGAVAITVQALPVDLTLGQFLNFGTLAPVTVTVNDSSVSSGETAITIVALPGPIPSGTRLNFTGGTNAQVVEVNGDHAAGVTTLTVLPLDGTVANSQTALFPGGTLQARLTAAAAAGATSLTVDELQFGIPDASVAVVGGSGPKSILPGTWMCEIAATGKVVPRAIRPSTETTIGLLESGASEDDSVSNGTNAYSYGAGIKTGYAILIGGAVYENLLPESTGTPKVANSTYKTEVQTTGVGTGFSFHQYGDTTS